MSCANATAPINLTKSTDNICNLKCAYSFNYTTTNFRINNRGSYLSFLTDSTNTPPVVYNDQNYNVMEARLYCKSLHTYDNEGQADAELIIVHASMNYTGFLIVCIPIMKSSTTTAESADLFDFIIAETQRTANSKGQQTVFSSSNLSLGKFIPLKPYYSYTGTAPVTPCDGSYYYVVFHKDYAITMSTNAYKSLLNIIPEPHNVQTKNNPDGVFYNPSGPTPPNTGEIYIDCQPTGEDGEVLVPARVDTSGVLDNELLKRIFNFTIIKLLVGVLVMLAIWKMGMKVSNGIAAGASRTMSSAINNADKIDM